MSTPSPLRVHLALGRVSNLPTVWSNVIAATVLGGAPLRPAALAVIGVSMSAFYVAGMYLNDAFDRHWDARQRPDRPIPAGWIDADSVFRIGYGLLVVGLGALAFAAFAGLARPAALLAGLGLGAAILAYDLWHKEISLSPVVMGLCRLLVYVTAALAAGALETRVLIGAAALLAYVVGLTLIARQETLSAVKSAWPLALVAAPLAHAVFAGSWNGASLMAALALLSLVARALALLQTRRKGAIPMAVGSLIAGIALVDALACAAFGSALAAAVCGAAFLCTRLFHRWIAGT